MRNIVLIVALFSSLAFPGQTSTPQTTCKVVFSVVQKDQLNNIQHGLRPENVKWFKDKMQKKYPDVCYAEPNPSVNTRFFITITTATYHGTRTVTETTPVEGTSRPQYDYDPAHASKVEGTVTSHRQVDNTFDYSVFTLSLQREESPDKWAVVHTFQKRGVCNTLAGFRLRCHPAHDVIEEAAHWIHNGGMSDPLQSVAEPTR